MIAEDKPAILLELLDHSPLTINHSPLFRFGLGIFSHQGRFGITLIAPFTIPLFRFFHNHEVPLIGHGVLCLVHRRTAFRPAISRYLMICV
jgi:hypothetical protein